MIYINKHAIQERIWMENYYLRRVTISHIFELLSVSGKNYWSFKTTALIQSHCQFVSKPFTEHYLHFMPNFNLHINVGCCLRHNYATRLCIFRHNLFIILLLYCEKRKILSTIWPTISSIFTMWLSYMLSICDHNMLKFPPCRDFRAYDDRFV